MTYGVLVQLMATGDKEVVNKLVPFFEENDFPYHLKSFDVSEDIDSKIETIAEFAASDAETFKLAFPRCHESCGKSK